MNPSKTYAPRSWTESERPLKNRNLIIAFLMILLVVLVAAFIKWIWVTPESQVFAFGYVVPQSNERLLPRPAFADWNLSKLRLEAWSPWLVSNADRQPVSVLESTRGLCTRITSKNELHGIPQDLRKLLREGQATSRDTLIVYLRGLSLVVPGKGPEESPQLYLLAPEDGAGSLNEPQGKPFAELISELQTIRAANIVVLADICDLAFVPGLGVVDNDVPAAITRVMQRAGVESNSSSTPIWLICSRTSAQPHHVSFLLEKTLLQSACEYALQSTAAVDPQQHLPLTAFYEAIVRYCDDVTGGRQIPVLFRDGQSGPIKDTNSITWKEAHNVHTAVRNPTPLIDAQDKDEVAVNRIRVNDQLSRFNQDRTLAHPRAFPQNRLPPDSIRARTYLVATQQQTPDQSPPTDGTTEAAPQTSGGPQEVPGPPPPDPDPWLRFWQLRDDWNQRMEVGPVGDGWSPADFAVERWQQIQREAIRLERQWRLSRYDGSTTGSENHLTLIQDLCEELGFGAPRSLSPGTETLMQQWATVRSQIGNPSNPQRAWLNPGLLPDEVRPQWTEYRKKLRQFVNINCDAVSWMELCQERGIGEIESLRPEVYGLVDQIRTMKEQLASRTVILDRPLDFVALERMITISSQLRERLDRLVEKQALLVQSDAGNPTWQDERIIQALLASPLLSYPQRKSLSNFFTHKEALADRLRRPGHNNWHFDPNKSWATLTAGGNGEGLDTRIWLSKLMSLTTGDSETDKWSRACVSPSWPINAIQNPQKMSAGILLPVSSDTRLSIFNLPSDQEYPHQLPQDLPVVLRHRNGTSMNQCWMDWKQVATGSASGGQQLEASMSGGGPRLMPERPHQVDLGYDDRFLLTLKPPSDQEVSMEGILIEVRFARQESELESAERRRIRVLPPNPDRVDLLAGRWDSNAQRLLQPVVAAIKEDNEWRLRGVVQAPAVSGQAKPQYQFFLCNRSDKDKVFSAKLYSTQSSSYSGNGVVTDEAIRRTRNEPVRNLQLIAQAEKIALPGSRLTELTGGAGSLPNNAQTLNLQPVAEGPIQGGNFGLVLIVDEEPAEGSTLAEPRARSQYFWIDCVSQTPCPRGSTDDWLVEFFPQPREGSEVDFELRIRDDNWQRWALESLRVEMLITDEQGRVLGNRSPSSSVEMGPKLTRTSFSARPNFDGLAQRPEKIVVHFHVGGYPRAVAFEYPTTGGRPTSATQAFLWLEPKAQDAEQPENEIGLTRDDGQNLVVNTLDASTFVIPLFQDVGATTSGTRVIADRLSIPFRVDFPKIPGDFSTTVRLGSESQIDVRFDRQLLPSVDLREGRLIFSSTASDHRFRLGNLSARRALRGRQPFLVSIDNTDIRKQVTIIFDVEKPLPVAVQLPDGSNLFEGEELKIELPAVDEDSGIWKVFFAINKALSNEVEANYDDQDIMLKEASYIGQRWIATIKQDEIKDHLQEVDSGYQIVARSVDFAGNVQNDHPAKEFRWRGKRPTRPPASKPK